MIKKGKYFLLLFLVAAALCACSLGEREKRILSLRFMSGKTQIEVSREVGISQAQVSRIEKGAMERIRKQL